MTDFYKCLNENDKVIKENEELHKFVEYLFEKISKLNQKNENDLAIISSMPPLLQALVKSHEENKDRQKHGKRYKNELIRNFAVYARDLGGKQIYEFWEKNLPLPGLTSVATYGKQMSETVIEGEFRFDKLSTYLTENGLPRLVWCEEDGTRVLSRIRYDPSTNQLVGFVPHLDDRGLPLCKCYEATSIERIEEIFRTEVTSNYAYVIMAQPLADVPPFCVSIFGTNNKFNTSHVTARWKWMINEAKKHDITIMGFSSDADSRLLSAMKTWTFDVPVKNPPEWKDFFLHS